MAGTYRKLKNGKWEICVSLGFELDGKRIRKYKHVEAAGTREVEKLLADMISEYGKADYSKGSNLTVKEFSVLWMKDHVRKNLKRETIDDYKEKLIRIVELLGRFKLKELTPSRLIQFYDYLGKDGSRKDKKPGGVSHSTMAHYHRILSSMMQDAVEWQMVKDNVCKNVRPPKQQRQLKKDIKKKHFTLDEAKLILEALNTVEMKYKAAAILGIFTGARRGEILGLEWKDIDFKNYKIDINKASYYTPENGIYEDTTKTVESERFIHVPHSVIVMLKNYKLWWNTVKVGAGQHWNETDRLFTQWTGKPMAPGTITKWFKSFMLNHPELPPITFHGLRHTHGSILLYMGMDIESVASQMGHNSIKMLIENYGHDVNNKPSEVSEKMGTALNSENKRKKASK